MILPGSLFKTQGRHLGKSGAGRQNLEARQRRVFSLHLPSPSSKGLNKSVTFLSLNFFFHLLSGNNRNLSQAGSLEDNVCEAPVKKPQSKTMSRRSRNYQDPHTDDLGAETSSSVPMWNSKPGLPSAYQSTLPKGIQVGSLQQGSGKINLVKASHFGSSVRPKQSYQVPSYSSIDRRGSGKPFASKLHLQRPENFLPSVLEGMLSAMSQRKTSDTHEWAERIREGGTNTPIPKCPETRN